MVHLPIQTILADVLSRAVKTNPWSHEAWCHHLRINTHFSEPCDGVYQRGYYFMSRAGSMEGMTAVIKMYAASLGSHEGKSYLLCHSLIEIPHLTF